MELKKKSKNWFMNAKAKWSLSRAEEGISRLKAVFLAIFLLSLCCLAFSFLAPNLTGSRPCKLCVAQRMIYFALLSVSFLGYCVQKKELFRKLLIVASCAGVLLASYHSLVYFKVLKTKCTAQSLEFKDESSFMNALQRPTLCSDKTLDFLGIPAPLANIAIYLFCLGAASKLSRKKSQTRTC